MSDIPPLPFDWDGEHMIPRSPTAADRYYVVGEVYRLVPHEERDLRSHNHYFASVHEAWKNLPEELADRFPSAEHLRKWALIKAGYRDERSLVCSSKAEARRVAAFLRPKDEYAVILVSDAVVIEYTAKSQSMRAMGKQSFGESKKAVLDVVAQVVGVTVGSLRKNAGQAA